MFEKLSQATGGKLLPAVISLVALVLLLVWLEGGFSDKVEPGHAQPKSAKTETGTPVAAVVEQIDQIIARPGTVRSRTETQVAPKIAARIEDIKVRAGDHVGRGQLLVRLDDRSLQAKLAQTRSALAAAQAEMERAQADSRRAESLYSKEAATRQQRDTAVAAGRAADARVRELQAAIREVEALFSETALTAPFDAVVAARLREPGDTAMPGTPILTLIEPAHLRVEVTIPESCMQGVGPGSSLRLGRGSGGPPLTATVDEIAPMADPATHTVLVKARLMPGAPYQAGAFVWVQQACGVERVLLIPADAVTRTGQIESVRLVRGDGHAVLRHIRTGTRRGELVEVLSGLQAGDSVLVGGS